jgi:DNA-binding transcriptional ArsR family regulator
MSRGNRSHRARHRTQAPIFAALGDSTRLTLVARLSHGDLCSISQLTQGTRLTRQAVTKHLRVLENADIVRGVRQGRQNLFSLNPEPIQVAKNYLDLVSEQWDETLSRLRTLVENE